MNLASGFEESIVAFYTVTAALLITSGGVFAVIYRYYIKSKELVNRRVNAHNYERHRSLSDYDAKVDI